MIRPGSALGFHNNRPHLMQSSRSADSLLSPDVINEDQGINRPSGRKRGKVSNLLFIIPDFFCIFPMNFAMATLGLKEIGQTFFPTFPKEFSHFFQT